MLQLCNEWGLNPKQLPRHIGIVMDGNGRWAIKKHLPRIIGHSKGIERVQEIIEFCSKLQIEALTLFAFSQENWHRPIEEVNGIMSLFRFYIKKEMKGIIKNNIQFMVIGERHKLPVDILELLKKLENATKNNTGLHLTIALSYSSHNEIVRAAKKIALKSMNKEIVPADIDENLFESYLDTSALPKLDMFIRTSGEFRLSNFLLWQLAYAELFFDFSMWPEFTCNKLVELLKEYAKRERRFGLTTEQSQKLC